ncbi:Unannotated [Lentimonas sp. CC11]|nr:Unannotated [Lentimonas sp. CC10]CAA7070540.1 Unannotated [Lentimonas sp. CC11]
MPFWFWNDRLDVDQLLKQLGEFHARGIYGVVIHPRIGLSTETPWMSDALLGCMRVVIEAAQRRGMTVVLYDEAMYPSGSSGGQVVAENPDYACRGMVMQYEPPVDANHYLVYSGKTQSGRTVYIVDRPIESAIRGVHFMDDSGDVAEAGETWWDRRAPEERPAATDLLNTDAVQCFVRLVYQRYYDTFGEYFGATIPAIFTDEPYVMGRFSPFDPRPGTTGILEHVNAFLGYDFAPHLPALWLDDEPDAERYRADYQRAIYRRLEETYYRTLSDWCVSHGVALTGHPANADDIGPLRHFQWPGQDVIMGDILPGELAVTGAPSTQAKCAASSAIHLGRSRNVNEFMGAYGEDISFETYEFVANWLLVRGCNLLVPHAFFYSVRGARVDDCPPQLGPNGPWWDNPELVEFHQRCQRLCWVNFEALPLCRVAVLGRSDRLPELVCRSLYENQIDFHYLEDRHLWEDAVIAEESIEVGPMHYDVLVAERAFVDERVLDAVSGFKSKGRLLILEECADFVDQLKQFVAPMVATADPEPWLRARIVKKGGALWCMLFNEGTDAIEPIVTLPERNAWHEVDSVAGQVVGAVDGGMSQSIALASGDIRLFWSES